MIENITKFRILDGALQYFTFKGIWKYLLTVNELEAIRNASSPSNTNVIATANDVDEATASVNVTYEEMGDLMEDKQLKPYLLYKITDRGDNGLVFRAAAVDRLESTGIRYMLCPATYATGEDAYSNDWIGVWNAAKQLTVTEGQLTIWNGLVNVAGAVLSGDAPDVEGSGYTVIPKASFSNHEYTELILNVTYDFEDDWINKQWDKKNNYAGFTKIAALDYGFDFNPVDYYDWNLSNLDGFFMYDNQISVAYNNNFTGNYFIGNRIMNLFTNCSCGNVGYNLCDTITNVIGFKDVMYNSNIGLIILNCTAVAENISIIRNSNNGTISGTFDADVSDIPVDKTGTAE